METTTLQCFLTAAVAGFNWFWMARQDSPYHFLLAIGGSLLTSCLFLGLDAAVRGKTTVEHASVAVFYSFLIYTALTFGHGTAKYIYKSLLFICKKVGSI